jgi:hypothetical protein
MINDKSYLNDMINKNKNYLFKTAKTLDLEIYDDNYIFEYLHKLYSTDNGIHINLLNSQNISNLNLSINTYYIPKEINFQLSFVISSTRQIDFRDIKIYDEVKKFIRFYEHSLNVLL